MDVPAFKKIFDSLDEEGQKNVLSQLSDRELDAISNYKTGTDIINEQRLKTTAALTPEGGRAMRIGAGKTFVDAYDRLRQLFSSPQKAEEIAQQHAYDKPLIEKQIASESPEFQASMGVGKAAPVAMTAQALPAPASIGMNTGLRRILYGGGTGGLFGATAGEPVQPSPDTSIRDDILRQAGAGMGLGTVGATLIEAAPFVKPTYALAKHRVNSIINPQNAKQTQDFAVQNNAYRDFIESGGDVTKMAPSQITGSPRLRAIESGVARSTTFSDQAMSTAVKTQQKALQELNNVLDKHGKKLSDPLAARVLSRSQSSAENAMYRTREIIANREYGAVKQLIGDKPVVGSNNYVEELVKIADELRDTGMRTQAMAVLKQARSYRDSVRTIDQAIKFRSLNNQVAAGKRGAFGLPKDEVGAYGKRLSDAITRDMDVTADVLSPQAKALLKVANDNYRKNSEKIEFIKDTVLGRVLNAKTNKPVEAFAEAMDKATPSQLAKQLKIIDDISPQFGKQARRMYIDRMISRSLKGPEAMASEANLGNRVVDLNRFVSELRKEENLNVLFKDKAVRSQVKRIANNLERLADAGPMGGAASMETGMKEFAGTAKGLSDIFVARVASSFVFRRVMYKAMFTTEGRAKLFVITAPNQSQAATSAALDFFKKELSQEQ